MNYSVRIKENGKIKTVTAREGTLILDVLRAEGSSIPAPCGGTGRCKKCLATIEGFGDVLTCQTRISKELVSESSGEIIISVPDAGIATIKTIGSMPHYVLNPIVNEISLKLDIPDITNQKPDDKRISDAAKAEVPIHLLPIIPAVLRDANFEVDCMIRQDKPEIVSISASGTDLNMYGVAVDIGTTTVSASLFDLRTGKHINTASSLNPQKTYGADVISRIDFASKSTVNLKTLQKLILDEILSLLFKVTDTIDSIKVMSLAGNTTMIHLLCGYNPGAIAQAPFIPVTLKGRTRYFHSLFPEYVERFRIDPLCIILPSISGYVGADITAGILATNLDINESIDILIDIGTNGEIALSDGITIISCSVAAGPAFEGANLTCGVGGISGAMDRITYTNNKIEFTTIGGYAPIGICGSGIVSAISAFLSAGVIDETGRVSDEPKSLPGEIGANIEEFEGQQVYVLKRNDSGKPVIYMNQKDIREVQNAKAAICAGIRLMISRAGFTADKIDNVYIAGGFGNFMNIDDAFRIGLLPPELEGKAKSVGNTSATGAALCMLEFTNISRCREITAKTRYYELSADKEFTDLYIDAMMFE